MAEDFIGISAHVDFDEAILAFSELIEKLRETGAVSSSSCDQIIANFNAVQQNLSGEIDATKISVITQNLESMRGAIAGAMWNAKDLTVLKPLIDEFSSTLQAAFDKTQEAYQRSVESADGLKQELKSLGDARDKLTESGGSAEEIDKLNAAYNETAQKVSEAELETLKYAIELKSLSSELERAAKFSEEVNKAIPQAATEAPMDGSVDGTIEKAQTLRDMWREAGTAAKEALVGCKDAFVGWATGHGKAQAALGKFKEALNDLPGPLGETVNGFKKMASSAKLFLSTPIGLVLGGLVFLLKAFQTWLSKSAEGQRVMAKVTAFVSSIMESLTEILIKVGGYLYHAFVDANGPMHDFAVNLGKYFVSALKSAYHTVKALAEGVAGLWDIVKNGVTGNWDAAAAGWDRVKAAGQLMSQAWSEAGDAILSSFDALKSGLSGAGTMIADAWDSFSLGDAGSFFTGMIDNARKAADIAGEQAGIEQGMVGSKQLQQAYDEKIAVAKEKAANASRAELKSVTEELRFLTSQKFQDQIDAQTRQVELLRKRNDLRTRGLKDIIAEQVAELQLYTLEQKRSAALRAIDKLEDKREKQINKAAEREAKAQERKAKAEAKAAAREAKKQAKQSHDIDNAESALGETILKHTDERVQEQQRIEDELAKARIAAMKNGAAKVRAQREYEHLKEMHQLAKQGKDAEEAEIKRQMEEFNKVQALRKAKGLSYRAWNRDEDLDTAPIMAIRQQYEELARLQQEAWDIESAKEIADKYEDYYTKRTEIEQHYTAELQELARLRIKARENNDQEEVDRLTRLITQSQTAKGKALVQNALDQIKSDPKFKKAFEDIGNASHSALQALADELRGAAADARNAGYDVSVLEAEIKKVQEALLKDAPFVAAREAADRARGTLDALQRARRELEFIKDGGKIIKSITRDDVSGKTTIEYKSEAEAQEAVDEAAHRYIQAQEKVYDATKQAIEVVGKLAKAFSELGSKIGEITGSSVLGSIAKAFGDIAGTAAQGYSDITKSADAIDKAVEAGDKAGAAIARINMWMAAISAMFKIVGSVQGLFKTSDQMYEDAARKQQEINNLRRAIDQYTLSALAARQAERNWFASSGLTSLTDAYEKHGKAVEAYYSELYSAQEKYHNKSAGLTKAMPYIAAVGAAIATVATMGAAGGAAIAGMAAALGTTVTTATTAIATAAIGAVAGSITAAAQAAIAGISYKGGQVAAKDNLRIKTRHKTFFRGEQTQDLAEWAKEKLGAELFDSEGLLNLEAAQTILDKYGDKLVGETKDTLERLIKLREQYNEFMKQVEEYVSDLYSPMLDGMNNALFDWLQTGTDVLTRFKENAKSTFADVAKDMVKQLLIKELFSPYSEQLKEIYAAYATGTIKFDGLANSVMAATDKFMADAEGAIPAIQDALTRLNDKFAERGFDLTTSSDEGSGSYNAARSFSQEQGDELNGRLTAIQIGQQQGIVQRAAIIELQAGTLGQVISLREVCSSVAVDVREMREIQYNGLRRLTEISVYTSVLPGMARDISDMRSDIRNKL